MAGPVPMALGPFLFRAHGFGYTDVSRALETPWAEIQTAGRLDALQWTGPKSEAITITGVLFPHEWGGLATLEAVKVAAKSGMPLMLVSLGGLIFGRHAIQRISEDRKLHDRLGTPRSSAYEIELRRLSAGASLLSLFGA